MDKKNIIVLLIIIVVILIGLGIGIWIATRTTQEKTIEVLPQTEPEIKVGDVGYGWSVKDDPREAVREAVSSVKQKLGGKSPKYVLFFVGIGKDNVGYNAEEVITELREQLGPDVQIHGGTSSLGVLTNDGFHIGEKGSIALMAVASEKMVFGVAGGDLQKFSPKELGKETIKAAIENTKKAELPQIIYMTASPGVEEEILPGIEEVVGTDVPIIGGSAGDNDLSGKWWIYANGQIYKNGVVLTAVYTDLKVGHSYEHGYLVSEHKGIVSKAKGRVLYKIDGKPAAEVYNEWTGNLLEETVKKGGTILSEVASFYPLARGVKGPGEKVFYISVMPFSVNNDKSLGLFANMENGDEVRLLRGNWELLLNRAYSTPKEALENQTILPEKGLFGIYTFCTGAMLAVPAEERAKFPVFVNNALSGIPFIGAFTLGEQIFLPGVGNRHSNLVNSMIVFGEK